jgi:hypothetical protein
MEKRSLERIPSDIEARFFYGKLFYTGKITDLSEKGMFISTKKCFPPDTLFLVMICENDRVLNMSAKVKRFIRTNGCNDGMGLEIMRPSADYLHYVDGLKEEVLQTV